MDPKLLIPSPDAIPAAWAWFKVILIPCFAVHLLFMNALLGNAIIAWANALPFGNRNTEMAGPICRKMPLYMAFTINFGVAALLFMQVLYGHLFYTSSVLMAVWWLAALALVLTAYAAAYWLDFQFDALHHSMRWGLLTLMVACLLLVGFVFVNNLTMMMDPSSWQRYFDNPGGTLWHGDDPTLIPRYMHFVVASVAVGGLLLAVLHRTRHPEKAAQGLRWFTAATAAQYIIGGWFFLSLPQDIRLTFMGGDQVATVLLAVSMLGVLLALIFGIRQMLWPAVWSTGFTVVGMVLVRDAVRAAYLAPYFSVADLPVRPQTSPMVVFGLFIVLGGVVLGYLLKVWKGAAPQ